MDTLREKCAVVGVSTKEYGTDAAHMAYQALFALQHRGVEASGIVTNADDGALRGVRRSGMVRDVFCDEDIAHLTGSIAVGHNRYSTSGGKDAHLQPVISEDINYMFAHNGNLPDPRLLEQYLAERRYVTGKYNDSELLGMTIASKVHSGRGFESAIAEAEELAVGAYSCVASYGDELVAFRDPQGIRPLEIGRVEDGVVFASETCALETIGAEHVRSVLPGELVVARNGEIVSTTQLAAADPKLDIFELVYFARHDSYLYGQRVNEVRRKFGCRLAELHGNPIGTSLTTTVMPIPDTSVPAAEGYARALDLPHEMGIVKNRYVGRTFMQPTQSSRRSNLRLKHTLISELFADRDIVMIDDSIVRGNTMPRLVNAAREMGARSVSVLIASPPVRFPDYYGVDTPSQDELLAANLTVEEMREFVGADYLGFLTLSGMVESTGREADMFNLASFNGDYVADIGRHVSEIRAPVSAEYMD